MKSFTIENVFGRNILQVLKEWKYYCLRIKTKYFMTLEEKILNEFSVEDMEAINEDGCMMVDKANDIAFTDQLYSDYHKDLWNEVYRFAECCNIDVSQLIEDFNQTCTDATDLRQQICWFYIENLIDQRQKELEQ